MKLLSQAFLSTKNFFKLVFSNQLHLAKENLGKNFRVRDGQTYSVFHDTISDKNYSQPEVTLIVHFRLKLIRNNSFFHWLFQSLCLLDTPVWVGFPGFRRKFWMVDIHTKDYLGIYRYEGSENAKSYAEYISAVLIPLSTKNSVWFEVKETGFNDYLNGTKI